MLNITNKYQLKGRLWIEIGNKAFIGKGKARLLKKRPNWVPSVKHR
jgi:hypothetical protein